MFHPAQCYDDLVRTADASGRLIAHVRVIGLNHFICRVRTPPRCTRTTLYGWRLILFSP